MAFIPLCLVSTYVVCERLSLMHYTFQFPEILAHKSESAPPPQMKIWPDLGTLSLSWSGEYPTPRPPEKENLGRSWQFEHELVMRVPPPPHQNLARSWHFEFELICRVPSPLGTRMWRLIAVSPMDTISFTLWLTGLRLACTEV